MSLTCQVEDDCGLVRGGLDGLWAEPLDQREEHVQVAQSQFVSGGCGYDVMVVVRSWPIPIAVDGHSVRRVVPVVAQPISSRMS